MFAHENFKYKLKDDCGLKEKEINGIISSIKKDAQDASINLLGFIDVKEVNKHYGKSISIYGMHDIDEFISECIAEYMNGTKKCRPIAKSIVAILLR